VDPRLDAFLVLAFTEMTTQAHIDNLVATLSELSPTLPEAEPQVAAAGGAS
jgi:hypothetical protein